MTCGPRMQISPRSPMGMSRPSSSRMAISVDEIGRPMLPLKARWSSGLMVAAGEVSDRP